MVSEDTFHWRIYICSHLCKRHYYSFIHEFRFENFVFVLSARTHAPYYTSPFFIAQPSPLENMFLLCRPGPLKKPFIGQVRWKNLHSFADPALLKNHFSSGAYGPWGRPRPLQTSTLYTEYLSDFQKKFQVELAHDADAEYKVCRFCCNLVLYYADNNMKHKHTNIAYTQNSL